MSKNGKKSNPNESSDLENSLNITELESIDATINIHNMSGLKTSISAIIFSLQAEEVKELLKEMNIKESDDCFENMMRLQDNLVGK